MLGLSQCGKGVLLLIVALHMLGWGIVLIVAHGVCCADLTYIVNPVVSASSYVDSNNFSIVHKCTVTMAVIAMLFVLLLCICVLVWMGSACPSKGTSSPNTTSRTQSFSSGAQGGCSAPTPASPPPPTPSPHVRAGVSLTGDQNMIRCHLFLNSFHTSSAPQILQAFVKSNVAGDCDHCGHNVFYLPRGALWPACST